MMRSTNLPLKMSFFKLKLRLFQRWWVSCVLIIVCLTDVILTYYMLMFSSSLQYSMLSRVFVHIGKEVKGSFRGKKKEKT